MKFGIQKIGCFMSWTRYISQFWAVEKVIANIGENRICRFVAWSGWAHQLSLNFPAKISKCGYYTSFLSTNLSDSNLVKFSHWIRDRYKVGGAHKVVMGSVCKTSRTLRVSNLGISCTKTPAACDQGAKTLDQADFAQPVSLKIDYRIDWLL